ncbi:MAG: CotH kinase family protein [Deltaproteobacteria bacterium]|nr:CotH kinase family protein [Deltaproteobacteria bacterium]
MSAMTRGSVFALLTAVVLATPVGAAPLIVNEFNAVSGSNYLNFGNATTDGDGNSINPPEGEVPAAADTYFGRIEGNGGDWIELVVVADHLDIRGWTLDICNGGVCGGDQLTFANHIVWADLRAGTIITVAEDEPTDLSFDPGSGDWWMNVQAQNGGPGSYITASNFPVNEVDWKMSILDDSANVVYGPIGEHVPEDPIAGCFPPQDNLNAGEIFRLEEAPSALVDPCIPTLNDYEDGVLSTFGSPNRWNSGFATQGFDALRNLESFPDRDGDQIPDDGDRSGIAGDTPCVGGATAGCDDNCGGIQNAAQADSGGPGGADGMGDVCQCGDPTGNDDVTAADILELRELQIGLRTELTRPERCSVHSDGQCSLTDLVVLDRTIGNPSSDPGLAPTCQAAALHSDQSDFMFDPNRLIEVNLRMSQADWDAMRVEELNVFGLITSPLCGTAPFRDLGPPYNFYDTEVTVDGKTLMNVGVRKKGFLGSLSTTKPSLKIKFDEIVGQEKSSGQQLNSMDRMTLNNNKQDTTHVTQCLGYDLMRQAGVPAPRCNFAHVTVVAIDGPTETTVVDGLYSHIDSIKDPFLRRNFGSDSDQGRLYEGTLSDFWPGSFRGTIEAKTQTAADDTSEIDALTTALEDPALTDAQRLTAIQGLVDVDDFLRFWAAEGLIGHWDGYVDDQNNFWFYVDPANDEDLIRFIPWGIDDTFGPGNALPWRSGDPTHAEAIVPRSALARRLYENSVTKLQYLAELQNQLDNVWNEAAIHAEINRMEALITPITGSLTTELNQLRTWVDDHRALVQAEINSPPTGFAGQPTHFCILNP